MSLWRSGEQQRRHGDFAHSDRGNIGEFAIDGEVVPYSLSTKSLRFLGYANEVEKENPKGCRPLAIRSFSASLRSAPSLAIVAFSDLPSSQDMSQPTPTQESAAKDLHGFEWRLKHKFRDEVGLDSFGAGKSSFRPSLPTCLWNCSSVYIGALELLPSAVLHYLPVAATTHEAE
ncbi:hypothetical protein Sjap_018373 [Stephania japonica]|uniref:Uncharacterized protein n=1 Tax=Stephania japonica TaxID=461633 RepID=A0AAP0I830_9MAGN